MDPERKKAVLRMIPYGIYVLTASSPDRSKVSAAAINWVTQCAFQPPLIVVGIKNDSLAYNLLQQGVPFALHFLSKEQARFAFDFFKETQVQGEKLNGHPFAWHALGVPILSEAPAYLIARVQGQGPGGDHTPFVAEVVEVGCKEIPQGRLDEAVAWLKDLGEKVYYGG